MNIVNEASWRQGLAMVAVLACGHEAMAQSSLLTGVQITSIAQPADDASDRLAENPDDHWTMQVAPYAWLPSFNGTVTQQGIGIDVDESFIDLVDGSDKVYGLMGALDVEYDRLVFQVNASFTGADFKNERGVFENGLVSVDLDLDASWVELFGGYRFIDHTSKEAVRVKLDGFVGARVTYIDTKTTVNTSVSVTLPNGQMLSAGNSQDFDQSQEWIEPFVGARLGLDLTRNWSINLRGDVGGFGVDGSDFSWQLAALAGYRWQLDTWDIGLFGGYRALSQDYSDGSFGWDVVTHGPVLGVQAGFRF